jgi:hypothetical protein
MKPICVACERFMRMRKAGYLFIEGMPKPGHGGKPKAAVPGKTTPERWQPYKAWWGDLWECPDCRAQIISGVGNVAAKERHQDGFDDLVKEVEHTTKLMIKDC